MSLPIKHKGHIAGRHRTHLLPPAFIDSVRSIVQSLSPERYRINMTAGGSTKEVISGQVIGAFIGQ